MRKFRTTGDPQLRGNAALGASLGLSRRQVMAAAAAGLAVPVLATATASPAAARPLVVPSRRGIILYSVRDAVSRDPLTSDLPSGFREVLGRLSSIGYQQIEFAGLRQNANAEGGADLNSVAGATMLRRWLDENGLDAQGNHGSVPATVTPETTAAFETTLDVAETLGLEHVGTGSDPTRSRYRKDWDAAAEVWQHWGAMAKARGIKLYTHNHQQAYNFLLDAGPLDEAGLPTRSTGTRMLEYFLQITDPTLVYLELDVFWAHVAQHAFPTYTAEDGTLVRKVFDPAALVAANRSRYPLFHAKDGDATGEAEGVGNGYAIVPFGLGDIDYATFFSRIGSQVRGGDLNAMWEQDTAPSATAPAQSLELAKLSYRNLSRLR